ncbi:MAG: FecR domain-containing protein [Cyclobacteriaceae bacterium]|nr:FecR domain-containing protein [Cyclobacteriaceae bacterium HetDA_MAG_MS6]
MKKTPDNIPSDELLVRYLANEVLEVEQRVVDSWRMLSAENESYFQRIRVVWLDTGQVSAKESDHQFDVDAAWENVLSRKEAAEDEPTSAQKYFNWIVRIAAVVALVWGGKIVLSMLESTPAQEIVFVADLAKEELTLQDSSFIALSAGSKLSYPEQFGDQRRVKLQGKAFFNVHHDSERPFVIEVGQTSVTVLGTSFYVHEDDLKHMVQVFVKSGKVRFATAEDEITLAAGESASFQTLDQRITKITPEPSGVDFFWYTGKLQFSDQKLSQVVDVLQRAYGRSVIVSNDELSNCSITVAFENNSLESILEIIALTMKSQWSRQDDQFILSGSGCAGP